MPETVIIEGDGAPEPITPTPTPIADASAEMLARVLETNERLVRELADSNARLILLDERLGRIENDALIAKGMAENAQAAAIGAVEIAAEALEEVEEEEEEEEEPSPEVLTEIQIAETPISQEEEVVEIRHEGEKRKRYFI